MKLALDHHYPLPIAAQLRAAAHDVVAAVEVGWEADEDEVLLEHCRVERRALLTNNVGDLATIARRWQAQDRSHAGLVFTSDRSMPRTRDHVGVYVERLGALLDAHPADDGFVDRTHWL